MIQSYVDCVRPVNALFRELLSTKGFPLEVVYDPIIDDSYGGIAFVYSDNVIFFSGPTAFRVGYHGVAPRELLLMLQALGSNLTINDIANLDAKKHHTLWKSS